MHGGVCTAEQKCARSRYSSLYCHPRVPWLLYPQVLPLKHRDEVNGPFPISEEPSDHVVLAAEYMIDRPSG